MMKVNPCKSYGVSLNKIILVAISKSCICALIQHLKPIVYHHGWPIHVFTTPKTEIMVMFDVPRDNEP